MMNWLNDALGEQNVKFLIEGLENFLIVGVVGALIAYGKKKSLSNEVEIDGELKSLKFNLSYKIISFIGVFISIFFIYIIFFEKHKNLSDTIFISIGGLLVASAMLWLFWVVWMYRLSWNQSTVFIRRWPFKKISILFNDINSITAHSFAQMYKLRSNDAVANVYVGQIGVAALRDDIKRSRPDLYWEWLA